MTKRCSICKQPITNTPYHHSFGNRDRCQKHCNCERCTVHPDGPMDSNAHRAQQQVEKDGTSVLGAVLAAGLAADVFSSSPDTTSTDTSVPDAPADSGFSGFGGGDSGGGGADGSF